MAQFTFVLLKLWMQNVKHIFLRDKEAKYF